MLKRLVFLFVLVPMGIILITLAVTNRQPVTIGVPPYVGDAPFVSFSMPLFALVFGAILFGILIGSFATWLRQGKHRKMARERKVEATQWHFQADKEKERAEELAQKVARTDSAANQKPANQKPANDKPAGPALPSPSKAA